MTQPTFPDRQTALEIWKQGIKYRLAHDGFDERIEYEYCFHSLGIAMTCEKIAALNPGMNPEKAWVLGLLHDYGKRHNERKGIHFHVKDGYEEMMKLGYSDVARICLSHSFPKKDFDFAAYGCSRDWLEWAHKQLQTVELDDYDRLVQMVDFMFEGLHIVSFEKRAESIVNRYHPKVPPTDLLKKAQESKAFFEAIIGQDIYQLLEVSPNHSNLPTFTEAEILFEVIVQKRNISKFPFTAEQESAFRAHSQATADIAATIAAAVDLCPEQAYILGLLHDCGRVCDENNGKKFHAVAGYQLMQRLDLPLVARISITHCFGNQGICAENYPFSPGDLDFCKRVLSTLEYNDYDHLIRLGDILNYRGNPCTIEQRFKDISERYQIPFTRLESEVRALQKIKGSFDGRSGMDIYDMLEISPRN